MLKNITLGQFIPGNSVIHRLDPRAKILLTILYVVVLFLTKGLYGYIALGGFVLFVIMLSGISTRFILRGLKPLIIILSLTMILHIFLTKGGTLLFQWRFIEIYSQGIKTGLFMATRLILLVMLTSLLTLTTSPIALTDGLEQLLNPFRRIGVPAHELAMMMTIALRFIPTLMEEADKIMKAQMARGADFESGNIMQRARALLPLLVPLFVSAFRRADDLAMAMEARCYRGGENRTRMKTLRYSMIDGFAALVMIAFSACIIRLRMM